MEKQQIKEVLKTAKAFYIIGNYDAVLGLFIGIINVSNDMVLIVRSGMYFNVFGSGVLTYPESYGLNELICIKNEELTIKILSDLLENL